jgi:cytidine deaminase
MTRDPSSILAAASAARRGAYAPYSRFFVGAAVLSRDGRLFTGVNIENASYGLSMCAERVALFTAVAAGARTLDAMAVVGPDGVVTLPCGACRQVLHEFAPQLKVVYAERGQVKITALATLLPEAFSAQTLTDGVTDRGIR